MRTPRPFVLLLALAVTPVVQAADPLDPLLARIKSVGREGAGNPEAASAWRELARQGAEELPTILAALDDADATADAVITAGGSAYFDTVVRELAPARRAGTRILLRSGAFQRRPPRRCARSRPAFSQRLRTRRSDRGPIGFVRQHDQNLLFRSTRERPVAA